MVEENTPFQELFLGVGEARWGFFFLLFVLFLILLFLIRENFAVPELF